MATHFPNGEFWLASYSQSVISSITGPVEKIFELIEVAPSSIDRAGWHGRKMATIQWLWSKFLPLLMFLLPGPIVSLLIKEVMTSTKQSSHSNLGVGGAPLMALSHSLAEDSSTSCLLARGFSTWLKMVVGDGWWPPSGSSISRSFIPSSRVIFTNAWMACLNSLMLSAIGQKSGFLGRLRFSTHVGGTGNKLLLEELDTALRPGRWVCLGGRPLGSGYGGMEAQNTSLLGTS